MAERRLTIEQIVQALPERLPTDALLRTFVPPPRFSDKRFANYAPRHPTQAAAAQRLERLGRGLAAGPTAGLLSNLVRPARGGLPVPGIYLDGGFGVGKTHLLAALWHEVPPPASYLTFDELMYFVGVAGAEGVAGAFRAHRLVAIDEWELDDPGNLKMAIAVLRRLIDGKTKVVVTSNTLPLELGAGRFSQKDFRAEIDELARAFEVIRIEGDDYRHRRYRADSGGRIMAGRDDYEALVAGVDPARSVAVSFTALMGVLRQLHPIRFRELVRPLAAVLVDGVRPISGLADALRWVHLIDVIYTSDVAFAATGEIALGEMFTEDALAGPFGKKLARCLSRLEELSGEARDRAAGRIATRQTAT